MPIKRDLDLSGARKKVVHEDTLDPRGLKALVGVAIESGGNAVALDRVPCAFAAVETGELLDCLDVREA